MDLRPLTKYRPFFRLIEGSPPFAIRNLRYSQEADTSMSTIDKEGGSETADRDPWEPLAEHRDILEMCIEEETPFADRAAVLLDRLAEEGYE